MRLSVACNFDPNLLEGLKPYPVYETYGKLTTDYYGGGRPSFYLPQVDEKGVESFVRKTHAAGVEFNYLLNASCMGNLEFTREGQRVLRETLDWLSEIQVDSITVANLFFLRTIKTSYPHFKVRLSAHRYTDNPRKVRFWQEEGADCIVVSEVNIYREFKILRGIREAATTADLQLIVNNSCRQDCAIAANHATGLSHASQKGSRGFPLDYSFVFCQHLKLTKPVNLIRANWIRPEDLHHYEELGFDNFKIVERNSPTKALLVRAKAYAERSYDGNLLDLVQAYGYPEEHYSQQERDAFSTKRMFKYFIKPRTVNLMKFLKVVELGQAMSLLYPRKGEAGVTIDNKALDGFIDRFKKTSCQPIDCHKCGYCHRWAEKVVTMDPEYHDRVVGLLGDLLDEMYSGSFWASYARSAQWMMQGVWNQLTNGHEAAHDEHPQA